MPVRPATAVLSAALLLLCTESYVLLPSNVSHRPDKASAHSAALLDASAAAAGFGHRVTARWTARCSAGTSFTPHACRRPARAVPAQR